VALGAEAVLPLLVGIEFGGMAQREGIVAVLRELEVDASTLESLRDQQLNAIRETVASRVALQDLPGGVSDLLRRRLDERISEGLSALLDLLSTLHDEPRIRELEHRLRRSSEGREHDLLIEAIESLLGREERLAIVPLLESGEWPQRARVAAEALGRDEPGRAEALADLCSSPDNPTRLLAAEISLEGDDVIGDSQGMPTAMEIAVHLQTVPAFDRLSTQQLLALGELLQEQKAVAGESIFRAGDEVLGLYFVLEGEVELRRGGLVVDRSGVGSYFGELSTLDGVPRSADAVATSEVRLLRLERDDLLHLLEEAPGLAIGLAQRLSSRVRRLEDRLEDAVSSSEPVP
jgi:hypothetical protein